MIDLKLQYKELKGAIDARISRVLDHGQYILGPEVFELEEKLADYVGVSHCITCGSGTDALLMSLMALGISKGDEVITSGFSFFASAEVISLLGAKPVFVDIDKNTFNLDVNEISSKITSKTKAIIPVSIFGQCSDLDLINETARDRGIHVIEDGAQSFGALYKGRRSCGITTIGCTSFFPAKPLGCYGDGGACFTNDDQIAKDLRSIRVHGQGVDKYENVRIGINSRLDTIQAAILIEKFNLFPSEIERRNEVAGIYDNLFSACDVETPKVMEGCKSVWAQYSLVSKKREVYLKRMHKSGIPTAVYYRLGLHQQKAYADLNEKKACVLPVVESITQNIFSVPMHPYLSSSDQERVVEAILSNAPTN